MPRASSSARRYAEAAFELATRDDAVDAWSRALDLASRLAADDMVMAAIASPARPLRDRLAVVDRLLDERVPDAARRLVGLLVERGRVDRLPAVAAEYRRLVNAARGIVEATVTTAAPLDDTELGALRRRVGELAGGRSVDLVVELDDALIGGLAVRIGDTLYDASVRGRLERLRAELVAGTR